MFEKEVLTFICGHQSTVTLKLILPDLRTKKKKNVSLTVIFPITKAKVKKKKRDDKLTTVLCSLLRKHMLGSKIDM